MLASLSGLARVSAACSLLNPLDGFSTPEKASVDADTTAPDVAAAGGDARGGDRELRDRGRPGPGPWLFDDRDLWVNHYGPAKTLAASLDDSRRAEFRRDMIAWHEAFPSPLGFDQPRAYLVTSARRK